MKKLKFLIVLMLMLIPVSVSAYNVVDLPEEMSLSEAFGIFSGDEITKATISNVQDGKYIDITKDDINDFYYAVSNMKSYRTINPTPFRGTAINLYTASGVVSYYVGSGVQIGLYGADNYICYKVKGDDEAFLTYLDTKYKDSTQKKNGEQIHVNTGNDFLKLPSAEWAQEVVKTAAKQSLVPYRLTTKYSNNISREEFCILVGQLITVTSEYPSLEKYVQDKQGAYLKNTFSDCSGKDSSIDILYALGIINGRSENTFDPDGTLSREEAAKIITAAAEKFIFINSSQVLGYNDRHTISSWAYHPVQWVTEKGIMNGMENNCFNPGAYYTVEQAIATVSRLFSYINSMIV